jgi:hypothetical protein
MPLSLSELPHTPFGNINSPMTYRPAPLFRFLPVFGGLGFFAFAALGVITALVEGAVIGLWVAGGAMLVVGHFIFNGWQVAYTLTLQPTQLTIRRLGRESSLPYTHIAAATLRQNTLTLQTVKSKLSLYGDPQGLTKVYANLQTLVPNLRQEKQDALTRALPIVHHRDIRPDLRAGGGIGAVCLFLLYMVVWSWVIDRNSENI